MSELCILFTDAGELVFGVFEGELLGTQIVAADIDKFLCVCNAALSSAVFVIQLLQFV